MRDRALAPGRTVPLLGIVGPVDLLEHRVVHVQVERRFNCLQIRPVSVRRQLHPMPQPLSQIVHEVVRGRQITGADPPRRHELSVGINGRPGPHVACTLRGVLRSLDVLLLRVDEAPNLVALDPATRQVPQVLVLVLGAGRAQVAQQLLDGHPGHTGHPSRCAKPTTLDEGRHQRNSLLRGQPIHEPRVCWETLFVKNKSKFNSIRSVVH